MQRLEARFHPLEKQGKGYIVVGYVTWHELAGEREPVVEPSPALTHVNAPATFMATLRHLVRMTSPRSLERLEALHSRYWSFVRVAASAHSIEQT